MVHILGQAADNPVNLTTTYPEPMLSPPSSVEATKHIACPIGASAIPRAPTCPGHFKVSPRSSAGLAEHLSTYHPELGTGEVNCPWPGCRCSPQARRGGRCDGRSHNHPAHMRPAHRAGHIWDAHLSIRHVCRECKRADWTSAFRLNSHRCGGEVPARCTECLNLFASEFDLVHHQLGSACGH
jgi:hypothetical protein